MVGLLACADPLVGWFAEWRLLVRRCPDAGAGCFDAGAALAALTLVLAALTLVALALALVLT